MNPRKFIEFFQTRTGNFVLFGILLIVGGTLVYGYRVSHEGKTSATTEKPPGKSPDVTEPKTIQREGVPFNLPKVLENGKPAQIPSTPPKPAAVLPITLYSSSAPEKELSENYAPYGRLIPCETVITIDSAKIETPIVGFVTEDLYHDGRLIVPAGAEVHGKAQTDRSRERIASDSSWFIIWRTTDRMNGAELPVKGLALDMERDVRSGTWALTDGSAGLRGHVIKTDNWAELKLFAATFISAASAGLQDTQQTTNAITGESGRTAMDSPKNAALQATSAVINEYARQIAEAIKRDGFYVRVPAGKQFYLYVTQTIDQADAERGVAQSQPPKQKP